MSAVKKHKDFLTILAKHGKSRGERNKIVDIACKGEIDSVCELFLNVLKNNVSITPKTAKALRKHRKQCRELINKKVSINRKKKILKGQIGGFLPGLIAGIAGPLLGTLFGARR
jgi:hypothetical protein